MEEPEFEEPAQALRGTWFMGEGSLSAVCNFLLALGLLGFNSHPRHIAQIDLAHSERAHDGALRTLELMGDGSWEDRTASMLESLRQDFKGKDVNPNFLNPMDFGVELDTHTVFQYFDAIETISIVHGWLSDPLELGPEAVSVIEECKYLLQCRNAQIEDADVKEQVSRFLSHPRELTQAGLERLHAIVSQDEPYLLYWKGRLRLLTKNDHKLFVLVADDVDDALWMSLTLDDSDAEYYPAPFNSDLSNPGQFEIPYKASAQSEPPTSQKAPAPAPQAEAEETKHIISSQKTPVPAAKPKIEETKIIPPSQEASDPASGPKAEETKANHLPQAVANPGDKSGIAQSTNPGIPKIPGNFPLKRISWNKKPLYIVMQTGSACPLIALINHIILTNDDILETLPPPFHTATAPSLYQSAHDTVQWLITIVRSSVDLPYEELYQTFSSMYENMYIEPVPSDVFAFKDMGLKDDSYKALGTMIGLSFVHGAIYKNLPVDIMGLSFVEIEAHAHEVIHAAGELFTKLELDEQFYLEQLRLLSLKEPASLEAALEQSLEEKNISNLLKDVEENKKKAKDVKDSSVQMLYPCLIDKDDAKLTKIGFQLLSQDLQRDKLYTYYGHAHYSTMYYHSEKGPLLLMTTQPIDSKYIWETLTVEGSSIKYDADFTQIQ